MARADFRLLRGSPAAWSRPTDGGRRLECLSCPDCGTRIWHQGSEGSTTLTVKAGTLDEPVDLSEAIHIWTRSRLPGARIPPAAQRFEQEPE